MGCNGSPLPATGGAPHQAMTDGMGESATIFMPMARGTGSRGLGPDHRGIGRPRNPGGRTTYPLKFSLRPRDI